MHSVQKCKILDQKEIKYRLLPIFIQNPEIRRVTLFGSFARNRAHSRSDIDLVVDTQGEMLGLPLLGLAADVEEILKLKTDLFEAVEIIPGSVLEQNISREGVVIYEKI